MLHYEALLADPLGVAERLSRFVHDDGNERVEAPEIDRDGVQRTVRRALDRSGTNPAEVTNPFVRELYDALRPCDGAEFDREALRDAMRRLGAIEDVFAPWPHVAARATARLRRDLRRAEARVEDLSAATKGATSREEIRCHCWELLEENARLTAESVDLRSAAEDHQRRAVGAEERRGHAMEQASGQIREHEEALERASLRIARKDGALEKSAERLREKNQALGKAPRQIARRDQALEEVSAPLREKDRALEEASRRPAKRLTEEKRKRERSASAEAARAQEGDRVRSELPYRIGEMVLEAYRCPLTRGWRLPASGGGGSQGRPAPGRSRHRPERMTPAARPLDRAERFAPRRRLGPDPEALPDAGGERRSRRRRDPVGMHASVRPARRIGVTRSGAKPGRQGVEAGDGGDASSRDGLGDAAFGPDRATPRASPHDPEDVRRSDRPECDRGSLPDPLRRGVR